jgi:T-complex protein 11
MPSRIRPLLHELLLVLLSIISPQTALVSTSPQSGKISIQQRRKQQQEQAQSLRAVLDVELIEQEMRHGLFDPSGAFEVIGQILKAHCAPMRDQAVDAMVHLAKTCAPGGGGAKADAVRAIRECFELLELMKLVRTRFYLPHCLMFLTCSAGYRQPPNADIQATYHPHISWL